MTERETEARNGDLGAEVPPEDALEQQQEVTDTDEDDDVAALRDTPDDVDPADRAEQVRIVGTDDDEYR